MPPGFVQNMIPVLGVVMAIEIIHSWREKKHLYSTGDTISNAVIGISSMFFSAGSKLMTFLVMSWIYEYRIITLPGTWWVWVLAIIMNDITFYWYHRICHEVNWFWASHVVHHSSEHMNISTAFRQSFTTSISGHSIFWLWMPYAGFTPYETMGATQLCLLYQSFLHTETVKKLPAWIEFIFNTPSHHRVHHSSNPEYLDKNHGGLFIIWDKLFGTFCEEKEKPRYGITTHIYTNNPLTITFHVWKETFIKAFRASSWKTAIHYFIQPPGWSPDGSSLTVKEMRRKEIQEHNGHDEGTKETKARIKSAMKYRNTMGTMRARRTLRLV